MERQSLEGKFQGKRLEHPSVTRVKAQLLGGECTPPMKVSDIDQPQTGSISNLAEERNQEARQRLT
jgi:hypothetical protein